MLSNTPSNEYEVEEATQEASGKPNKEYLLNGSIVGDHNMASATIR
jgi:hypothetical protein